MSPTASVTAKSSNGDLYVAKFASRNGEGLQVRTCERTPSAPSFRVGTH